jgi:hypothetical protein
MVYGDQLSSSSWYEMDISSRSMHSYILIFMSDAPLLKPVSRASCVHRTG